MAGLIIHIGTSFGRARFRLITRHKGDTNCAVIPGWELGVPFQPVRIQAPNDRLEVLNLCCLTYDNRTEIVSFILTQIIMAGATFRNLFRQE